MLNILHGRAGAGKTEQIMQEIKFRMARGETGMLLIVPEQYSHDAERRLCAVCGDALSLHAEVLTFTSLSRHIAEETGGGEKRILDKSGQILVMHKALEAVGADLKVFGMRKTRTQMLESLLAMAKEFKSMCVTPEALEKLASKADGPLSDKLRDFAMLLGAYDALLADYGSDAAERLAFLASKIGESAIGRRGHIYFDGFNDFTAQEMLVIEELLKCGADVTVCLTCELDGDETDRGYEEVFMLPRRTVARLCHMPAKIIYTNAAEARAESRQEDQTQDRSDARPTARAVAPELAHLERHIFSDRLVKFTQNAKIQTSPPNNSQFTGAARCAPAFPVPYSLFHAPVTICAASSRYEECEYAAAAIWDMVRSGYRWRDIGVMARDYPQYESVCEQVFEKYGIQYFSSGKAGIQGKPPLALIDAALEIATSGWEYNAAGRYLKTGLLQLTTDEIAVLENYIIKWNIRGSMWTRRWLMPPSGYRTGHSTEKEKAADGEMLTRLNNLRERVTQPLEKLRRGIKGQSPAEGKLRALYEFMKDIALEARLLEKAGCFRKRGQPRLADEYTQLLDIIIDAMDQVYTVLGGAELSAAEFRKLMSLVLSQHDVGVIPVRLDAVLMGAMAMSRRRDLKALIILGATDENIPQLAPGTGVLSDNERAALAALDEGISSGLEERLYREMNMIYSSLTLPSERLVMIYDKSGGSRPCFVIKRLCEMFGLCEMTLTEEQYMSAAEGPYLELQSRRRPPAERTERESLSPLAAERLYGKDLALSATRVDRYYSCAYRHFLQSGLRLSPRRAAQFDAASAGDFMHSVLEGVFKEIGDGPGFKNVEDAALTELASKYTEKYVKDVLLDFEGKNARFEYLFRRYEQSVVHVLRDMAGELALGEFAPVGFEMDISQFSKSQRGFIDRVDAYEANGRLYLRVVDYKTRKKAYAFELGDVLHGRDMQMLIYLFALQKHGKEKFGAEPVPAGVLYIPARDVFVSAAKNAADEDVEKLRVKEMRRSGLVLGLPHIIEAMEGGEHKKYLPPIKVSKDGEITGSCLVTGEQLEKLSEHVQNKMERAKSEILGGRADCEPYYKSVHDNACTYCEFFAVCRFDEQMGDKRRFVRKMKPEEVWEELGKG